MLDVYTSLSQADLNFPLSFLANAIRVQELVVQTPISLIHRLNFFNPPTEVG